MTDQTQADRASRGAEIVRSYAGLGADVPDIRNLVRDLRAYVESNGGDFEALAADRCGWAARWGEPTEVLPVDADGNITVPLACGHTGRVCQGSSTWDFPHDSYVTCDTDGEQSLMDPEFVDRLIER